MTAAIFKLQDILLSRNENANNSLSPVVFLTEYEHNSNYLSWMNRNCECVIIKNNELGQPDIKYLKEKLEKYKERKIKIASLSACSNITGIIIELKPIINLVKKYNVITCVDYTTLAPYKNINLLEFDNKIDALFFSGHKFLGGVGSSGILLINKSIYNCDIPTRVGGGVIEYVKPNKQIVYKNSIDEREEAGTPGIIQTIKASLALKLKEQMGSEMIDSREKGIVKYMLDELSVNGLEIYDYNIQNRIAIISFNTNNCYNMVVQELSDEYGIQARGGCCCAAIYVNKLFENGKKNKWLINKCTNYNEKPGIVRISVNPVMSDSDIEYICSSIKKMSKKYLINKN